MQHCCKLPSTSLACRDRGIMHYSRVIFKRQSNRLRFQPWLAVLLLSLYVCGTIGADLGHQFFHAHHDTALHTVVQEKDPCHRALYHHDITHGCHHRSHVGKVEKHKHCHTLFHADQLIPAGVLPKISFQADGTLTGLTSAALPGIDLQQSLRGPPAI